jgi:cold shock CspA family protein
MAAIKAFDPYVHHSYDSALGGIAGKDVFVHISTVKRAGMSNLNEGQGSLSDVIADRRTGKLSAENLRAV